MVKTLSSRASSSTRRAPLADRDQDEVVLLLARGLQALDQAGDAGGIDIGDLAQIDQDVALLLEVVEQGAAHLGRVLHVDFAGQGDHDAARLFGDARDRHHLPLAFNQFQEVALPIRQGDEAGIIHDSAYEMRPKPPPDAHRLDPAALS